MKLIEIHNITRHHKVYDKLYEMSKLTNALRNQSIYLMRQHLRHKEDDDPFFICLDKLLKTMPEEYNIYRKLPAQTSQQTIRVVEQSFRGYSSLIKDWHQNKEKYSGKPRMPGFGHRNAQHQVIFTNQQINLINGKLTFPKCLRPFSLKLRAKNVTKICQVRCLPRLDSFKIEVIYEIDDPIELPHENVAAIDIGLDNFATLVFSHPVAPCIFKGSKAISYHLQHMKKVSELQSELWRTQKSHQQSKRVRRLREKRQRYFQDVMHKLSHSIVNQLLENNVTTLIVGHNSKQKEGSRLKTFTKIPIFGLLKKLEYKCKKAGIAYKEVNESHTSGTSFLDDELPTADYYDKSRRVNRSIFISNEGRKIHADVNAAYQIMRKAFPSLHIDYDSSIFNPRVIHFH